LILIADTTSHIIMSVHWKVLMLSLSKAMHILTSTFSLYAIGGVLHSY